MFLTHQKDRPGTEPLVQLDPTVGESYVVGELLKMSSGKATKASGTDSPAYICVSVLATAADGDRLEAVRIQKDIIYATALSAAGTALVIGDKVTVATDGLRVTATTTSGVAEIVGMEGTASGSTVYVRF